MKQTYAGLGVASRLWRWIAPALVAMAAALPPSGIQAQVELRLNRIESYVPKFVDKRRMNRRYRPALTELHQKIHKRLTAGENMSCSSQIFKEAHWLVNYTTRTEDIERRIEDLRNSLDLPDQSFASRQDPKDGSFGPCYESWLWRFFSSVDPLKDLAARGEKPKVALKIWEPVDTPEEITALMRDLLVSDLSSGHNKRKELNLAITALGQLLWLNYTDAVFPEYLDRTELAAALREFSDNEWQDPGTGYWGAWYRDGSVIRKTNDLSITFHMLSYRSGDVDLLRKIARTTGAIRRVKYPFGWNTGGAQNNHHAYDVLRIVNLAWDELDPTARSFAQATIFLMTARALALSIDDKGAFDPKPYGTVGEAYYFGLSFFSEVGLFGNETARTTIVSIANTETLLDQIEQSLSALDRSDPWVVAAHRKLNKIKNER